MSAGEYVGQESSRVTLLLFFTLEVVGLRGEVPGGGTGVSVVVCGKSLAFGGPF